jgi:hypothetical protein
VPQPGLVIVECGCRDPDSRSWGDENAEDSEDRWMPCERRGHEKTGGLRQRRWSCDLAETLAGLEIMGYWAVNSTWT